MVVAGYELTRFLRSGGMGQVWLARERSLDRVVALKLMLPGMATERARQFFSREGRAGARVQHPGLVAVFQAGEADGIAYIAQEYVMGGGRWPMPSASSAQGRSCRTTFTATRRGSSPRSRKLSTPHTWGASSTGTSSLRTSS
jgi:serine/threonine protein kinase